MAQDGVAPVLAALAQAQHGGAVVDRRAQAVDAAHAGDDDHVAPLEQGVGRGVAELVDLLVPARVLLDVRVGPGQVGLGLVVVEVADEVLDGVVREELAELGVQLGRQGLVVGQDQGRLLVLGDRVGDRPGLARAGHAEQGLVAHPRLEAVDQALDGGRLVPRRFEVGDESEIRHDGRLFAPGWNAQDITARARTERVFCCRSGPHVPGLRRRRAPRRLPAAPRPWASARPRFVRMSPPGTARGTWPRRTATSRQTHARIPPPRAMPRPENGPFPKLVRPPATFVPTLRPGVGSGVGPGFVRANFDAELGDSCRFRTRQLGTWVR